MQRIRLFLLTTVVTMTLCGGAANAGENPIRQLGKDAAEAGRQVGKAGKKVGKDIGKAGKKVGTGIRDSARELFRD